MRTRTADFRRRYTVEYALKQVADAQKGGQDNLSSRFNFAVQLIMYDIVVQI